MRTESNSTEMDLSPEKLKEIYQDGFIAGTNIKNPARPEENPYAYSRERPLILYPLAYSVEWEKGREAGQDATPGISKLSPDLMEAKKRKLSQKE